MTTKFSEIGPAAPSGSSSLAASWPMRWQTIPLSTKAGFEVPMALAVCPVDQAGWS
jgi:hypothetical protein